MSATDQALAVAKLDCFGGSSPGNMGKPYPTPLRKMVMRWYQCGTTASENVDDLWGARSAAGSPR